MPERRKRLLTWVLVVAALPLLLWLAMAALFPKERFVARLAAEVEARTGAEFRPGEVSVRPAGGLALALGNGRFTHRDAAGNVVDVAYDRLELGVALWPLVKGQVRVDGLRVAGPAVVITRPDQVIRCEDYEVAVSDVGFTTGGVRRAAGAPGEAIPPDLACRFAVRVGTLVQGATAWRDVTWQGEWADRRTSAAPLRVGLGDGEVRGTLGVDYAADPWGRATVDLELVGVPAALLLAPYQPDVSERLRTDLTGTVRGGLDLRDRDVMLATLALAGELHGSEGVLEARDWLRSAEPYLGARRDLVTIRFGRLDHRFTVRDGRYRIELLELDGTDTDWQARGELGFDGTIDLAVGVRLPRGFTPDLGAMSFLAETLRDGEGRIRLGLKLGGQTAAPTVGLDFSRPR